MANSTTIQVEHEEDIRATYAGAKRRIAALQQQLQEFKDVGVKRKS